MIVKYIKDFFPETDCDVEVMVMAKSEYKRFMKSLYIPEPDPRAMAVISPVSIIIINIDTLEDDLLYIVLAHEYGHIVAGEKEEDADRVALTLLSEEDSEYLKANWYIRHGHEFSA